ncbi:MAG TPA: alpha-2-macroglobulin family protein [Phycisphaerae bacterium]|nr:alpha-2-macroglobulin family protein [Phycisphaerae bacterium]
MRRIALWIVAVLVLALCIPLAVLAAEKTPGELRTAYTQGNYKDAYDGLAPKVTSPAGTDDLIADFEKCVAALNNLGRSDEVDDFREKAIAAHKGDWRFLDATARSYQNEQHYGQIVAGVFHRGNSRNGDGKWVNSLDRDRVRALQIMGDAAGLLQKVNPAPAGTAEFYYHLGELLLLGDNGRDAWRLQNFTDLTKLPDYEETPYPYYRGYYGGYYTPPRGAPVDGQGNPVLHQIPKGGWAAAKTDGERWRWALMQAGEYSPAEKQHANLMWGEFLRDQFGVQTMAYYGGLIGSSGDNAKNDESGPYAVHTLKDGETIARLASGVKRLSLPDEFNYIKQLELVANSTTDANYQLAAMSDLGAAYEDRQQFDSAAKWWRAAIEHARNNPEREEFQRRLDQIVGNWGMFENTLTQPAGGRGAAVDFRFRNGDKVSFTAAPVDVAKLLADIRDFLKTRPNTVEWNRVNLGDIGYRLLTEPGDKGKYLLPQVAAWDMALEPRPAHFDARVTVQTPLQKAGAYLLSATMRGGNTTNILVWVADTALLRKPLSGQSYTYVADAITGQPIAGAQVEMFGYRQVYIGNTNANAPRQYRFDYQETTQTTDKDGQVIVAMKDIGNREPDPVDPRNPVLASNFQWVTIATTHDGRIAFSGFTGIWAGSYYDQYDQAYNQTKVFGMTDRPVYRPAQKVQWKMWVGENKYDKDGKSPFAGQSWTVRISNAKGTVKDTTGTLDEWGGISGELDLEKDATLGVYSLNTLSPRGYGVATFRVEEYKKPEFEVKIDAPGDPVMLGDKVTATINARYYFGSPVTNATVKVKVTRTAADARWFPRAPWDWYYEPGYWWFAHDYLWYPGWARWGTFAPVRHWFSSYWPPEQPEVVSENETPLGADGTVKVDIDTAVAKAAYGDQDHKYEISAEVTDASRRTIVGSGSVLVSRQPFRVYAWVDRGYYGVGDTVRASFSAQTLDNKPVTGKGVLKLLRITYDEKAQPVETAVQQWDVNPKEDGQAEVQINAQRAGQYRLSYSLTDAKNRTIEGGYVFLVRGEGFNGREFRFNDIEITTDKQQYAAGEKVKLLVNAQRADATVLLFLRPANGVYLAPKVVRLQGKSAVEEIDVGMKDMPNFFVEADTVANARVYTDVREVIVPPADRILNVSVTANAAEYKPGEKAKLTVKVTEKNGEPFTGSTVLSLYDKSVEYISGGTNIGDIRKYFWQWRRTHYVYSEDNLARTTTNQTGGAIGLAYLGIFGVQSTEYGLQKQGMGALNVSGRAETAALAPMPSTPAGGRGGAGGGGGFFSEDKASDSMADRNAMEHRLGQEGQQGMPGGLPGVEPAVRSNFADTALWAPNLVTAVNGIATVEVAMPENLTTWKARVWTLGNGSRVGQGDAEVVTRKNLIVRLEAPRFFTQTDEVVLSAIVHNYLKTKKQVRVSLEMDVKDGCLWPANAPVGGDMRTVPPQEVAIAVDANGEQRVDWRVQAMREGSVVVRMKAITDEESDAMQMTFPVYVHGMLKTDSFAGALRGEAQSLAGSLHITVPAQRRPEQTLLEVRYSPSLASAMVDALPYMVDYPYGCTEQTLNRFVPAVITQKILVDMKLDLNAIRTKRTNLNAQEIGDPTTRAAQWGRQFAFPRNPVFDKDLVADMVRNGVTRLSNMQNGDGGWGWFSGSGEASFPHTTAVVVHGLQTARAAGGAVDQGVIDRGVTWLRNYQTVQLQWLHNYDEHKDDANWTGPRKQFADDIDALCFMVLVDAGDNYEMKDYLYRDRTHLAFYTKCMFGLALDKLNDTDKLKMILDNCRQFVVQDDENQTAYLKLPEGYWWYWYGSEFEAHAYYLKLLARTDPKGQTTSRLAKYLINNRRGGTYWTSTRDTAVCIEALADYIKASGEDRPDMTVKIAYDGKPVREEKITAENLFSFNNAWTLPGLEVANGAHTIEVSRTGSGPLYYNAYLTNFTMEDHITRAGLEIKVNRKVYLLTRDDRTVKAEGARGQAVDKRVEKYVRTELSEGQTVKSGDLVEVELTVDSKNDYEYIVVEDMKGAGFEPVEVRSGYNGNDMNAYVEFRDERVAFFVRLLGRGTHSVSYRLRAEVPGAFSALPAKASAMYAPELRANSDEIKLHITDAPAAKQNP